MRQPWAPDLATHPIDPPRVIQQGPASTSFESITLLRPFKSLVGQACPQWSIHFVVGRQTLRRARGARRHRQDNLVALRRAWM